MRACVRACVRVCVRACVRACACVRAYVRMIGTIILHLSASVRNGRRSCVHVFIIRLQLDYEVYSYKGGSSRCVCLTLCASRVRLADLAVSEMSAGFCVPCHRYRSFNVVLSMNVILGIDCRL